MFLHSRTGIGIVYTWLGKVHGIRSGMVDMGPGMISLGLRMMYMENEYWFTQNQDNNFWLHNQGLSTLSRTFASCTVVK